MHRLLNDLRILTLRHARGGRTETAIPRVTISVLSEPTEMSFSVYQPMHCLVLQGAKEAAIGNRVLRYDNASCFTASMELPASARIVEASRDLPYVGVALALDWEQIAALIPDVPAPGLGETAAFGVSPVAPPLLDPWLRLLRLLDAPADIPVLAPLFEREILYRLLQGPQGSVLRQIALADGRLSQIRRAIMWIRAHYDEALRVDMLAEIAGMSGASFHRHFKAATAMSPLQYQKSLRLQQARRLLIANQDASQAGYAVGYESASQFSREYTRAFGASPARDAVRLRGSVSLVEGAGA
jgi:AraC-like DNA-binding protein